MREPRVRNSRAEADSLLSGGHRARVLEPSPPARTDPEAGADDPTDPSMAEGPVVTPIPGEGISWDSLAEARPELEGFVAANWLGERGRLRPLPERFAATRDSLHQFAFFALAPKRFAATRRMGLRYTRGGFGTPFFGADEQVRVEGDLLVHQRGESLRWQPLGSVGEACRFLDLPYRPIWYADFRDPLEPAPPATTLEVEAESVDALGEWFGFATLVLERLRRLGGSGMASRVQIWPEHFDAAIEVGPAGAPPSASCGASPGDAAHPEPYLYVAPWGPVDPAEPYWNDPAFGGASLAYGRLCEAVDPVGLAAGFFRKGLERLSSAR